MTPSVLFCLSLWSPGQLIPCSTITNNSLLFSVCVFCRVLQRRIAKDDDQMRPPVTGTEIPYELALHSQIQQIRGYLLRFALSQELMVTLPRSWRRCRESRAPPRARAGAESPPIHVQEEPDSPIRVQEEAVHVQEEPDSRIRMQARKEACSRRRFATKEPAAARFLRRPCRTSSRSRYASPQPREVDEGNVSGSRDGRGSTTRSKG